MATEQELKAVKDHIARAKLGNEYAGLLSDQLLRQVIDLIHAQEVDYKINAKWNLDELQYLQQWRSIYYNHQPSSSILSVADICIKKNAEKWQLFQVRAFDENNHAMWQPVTGTQVDIFFKQLQNQLKYSKKPFKADSLGSCKDLLFSLDNTNLATLNKALVADKGSSICKKTVIPTLKKPFKLRKTIILTAADPIPSADVHPEDTLIIQATGIESEPFQSYWVKDGAPYSTPVKHLTLPSDRILTDQHPYVIACHKWIKNHHFELDYNHDMFTCLGADAIAIVIDCVLNILVQAKEKDNKNPQPQQPYVVPEDQKDDWNDDGKDFSKGPDKAIQPLAPLSRDTFIEYFVGALSLIINANYTSHDEHQNHAIATTLAALPLTTTTTVLNEEGSLIARTKLITQSAARLFAHDFTVPMQRDELQFDDPINPIVLVNTRVKDFDSRELLDKQKDLPPKKSSQRFLHDIRDIGHQKALDKQRLIDNLKLSLNFKEKKRNLALVERQVKEYLGLQLLIDTNAKYNESYSEYRRNKPVSAFFYSLYNGSSIKESVTTIGTELTTINSSNKSLEAKITSQWRYINAEIAKLDKERGMVWRNMGWKTYAQQCLEHQRDLLTSNFTITDQMKNAVIQDKWDYTNNEIAKLNNERSIVTGWRKSFDQQYLENERKKLREGEHAAVIASIETPVSILPLLIPAENLTKSSHSKDSIASTTSSTSSDVSTNSSPSASPPNDTVESFKRVYEALRKGQTSPSFMKANFLKELEGKTEPEQERMIRDKANDERDSRTYRAFNLVRTHSPKSQATPTPDSTQAPTLGLIRAIHSTAYNQSSFTWSNHHNKLEGKNSATLDLTDLYTSRPNSRLGKICHVMKASHPLRTS